MKHTIKFHPSDKCHLKNNNTFFHSHVLWTKSIFSKNTKHILSRHVPGLRADMVTDLAAATARAKVCNNVSFFLLPTKMPAMTFLMHVINIRLIILYALSYLFYVLFYVKKQKSLCNTERVLVSGIWNASCQSLFTMLHCGNWRATSINFVPFSTHQWYCKIDYRKFTTGEYT